MSSINLYIGLPGSGKTHLASKECDVIVDDITDMSELPGDIEGIFLGITDVNFCDSSILEHAKHKLNEMYPASEINQVFFENDVDKCRRNVYYRNDGRYVDGTIKRFESIYSPPADAIGIWMPDEN